MSYNHNIHSSIAKIIRFSPHIIEHIKLQNKKEKKQESEKHVKEKGKIAKKRNKGKSRKPKSCLYIFSVPKPFSIFTAPHKITVRNDYPRSGNEDLGFPNCDT